MRLLGPFRFEVDEVAVEVTPKERVVLALLALRAGRPVLVHELAAALWVDDPPPTVRKSVQVHVSRLRRRIERAGVVDRASVIVTVGDGYALAGSPLVVDAVEFERMVDRGRTHLADGDVRSARDAFGGALGLWGGEPLWDLSETASGAAERTRLTELRAAAAEAWIDTELSLGHHHAALGALEQLVAEYPLREHLWAQLLLALYRSGRQGDALRAYQRARTTLVEQLGLEPGPDLRRLEAAIVAQDPALDLRSGRETAGSGPAGRGPTVPAPEAPPPVASGPRAEVAVDPVGRARPGAWAQRVCRGPLVGRRAEIDQLERAVMDAAAGLTVVVVSGGDGLGKSRLLGEFASRCVVEGGLVLAGRCTRGQAMSGFRQVVDRWAREDAVVAAGLPATTTSTLTALSAVFADLAGGVADPAFADPYLTSAAVVSLVDQARGGRPAVLLLDDLHAADEATIEATRRIVEDHPELPLLIVLALRGNEAEDTGGLLDLLDDLHHIDAYHRVGLGPLDLDESVELVRLAGVPGVDLRDAGAVHRLCREVGCVPRYLLAIARHWSEEAGRRGSGWVPVGLEELGMPASLHDLLRRRLRSLAPLDRTVLEVAATLDGELDPARLGHLAGVSTEDVAGALDRARRAGLVAVAADGGTSFVCDAVAFSLCRDAPSDGRSPLARPGGAGSRSVPLRLLSTP